MFLFNAVRANIVEPPKITIKVGGTAKFLCYSEVRVTWKFQGGRLPLNTATGRMRVRFLDWLIISEAQLPNSGVYSCYSENETMVLEDHGVLQVISKCKKWNGLFSYCLLECR